MKKIANRMTGSILTAIVVLLFVACSSARKTGGSQQQYMSKQYRELKNVLNEAEVSIIKDSVKVIFPNNVLFASSSDQLKEEIKPTFQRFANVLTKYGKTKILVTGHTDNTGAPSYNRELSERRAASGKQLLITDGVSADRMLTWGLGDRAPVATNDTDEGKARNRRVEFVILYDVKQ
ncbi:OmpA family protein [Chitinophaga pendula]|uniref:OmpA family protein n=1 Tax=Chitinophaga TaxID=79328 RepID=UPI000BAFD0CC|nr:MULTISPECIES: OmpA family protein [Chitinophaga]ASZ11411.1 hypothetical protein CK934_10785 [Chitinophaga sp. MD30]UCJ05585.1 OmpA family protein [Chitinophaga pendula]